MSGKAGKGAADESVETWISKVANHGYPKKKGSKEFSCANTLFFIRAKKISSKNHVGEYCKFLVLHE